MLWYLQPHIILVKGILVCVEAFEVALIAGAIVSTVHRGILLMTEYDASTGLTFSCCLAALTAEWFLFVAFELSLTAGQAVTAVNARLGYECCLGGGEDILPPSTGPHLTLGDQQAGSLSRHWSRVMKSLEEAHASGQTVKPPHFHTTNAKMG